jgi:hypothetical protein
LHGTKAYMGAKRETDRIYTAEVKFLRTIKMYKKIRKRINQKIIQAANKRNVTIKRNGMSVLK